MTKHYLGADLGATKIHILITDNSGKVEAFAEGGSGNHEAVGYHIFQANLQKATNTALQMAGLKSTDLSGCGFGIAGYDWPSEKQPMMEVIDTLHLGGSIEIVNDTELGILVGSPRGWGVTVVSGTGCNCRGWDETRTRFGRITGGGLEFGEFAGAGELIFMTARALAYAWTGRGPATALTDAFVERYGAKDLGALLEEFITRTKQPNPADARLVFQVAATGDAVAVELIRWAGQELGMLANTVIRQLQFERTDFDLVLIGSMFDGSPLLVQEMENTVYPCAPAAHFIRAQEPPVVGALLLGMESTGIHIDPANRSTLIKKIGMEIRNKFNED